MHQKSWNGCVNEPYRTLLFQFMTQSEVFKSRMDFYTVNTSHKFELNWSLKEGFDELEKWGKHCLYNCAFLAKRNVLSLSRKPKVNNTFDFQCTTFFNLSFVLFLANPSIEISWKDKYSSNVNSVANSSSMYLSGNCQTEGIT